MFRRDTPRSVQLPRDEFVGRNHQTFESVLKTLGTFSLHIVWCCTWLGFQMYPDRLVTNSNAGYLQPMWGIRPRHSDFSRCNTDSRMEKLPKELTQLIDGLCRKGDQFAGMDQYDDAIEKYSEAWNLLPEPRDQWPAATWILISVGDAHFRLNEFAEGADILLDALHFPDGEDNPFLLLRLGQCLLELGRLDEAADALEEAYRRGGDELFADEDPKYLGFFKTQKKITPPGRTGRFNHPLG